jgi:hypothetical protein
MVIWLQTPYVLKQWAETEHLGLTLRPAINATCVPHSLCIHDIPLMEIATEKYNKKGFSMINRCRIILHLFSVYDLLLLNTPNIHPSYLCGERPLSRISSIIWPQYPRPPKKYWGLWGDFLRRHVMPLLPYVPSNWQQNCNHRYQSPYYKHRHTPHLYCRDSQELTLFHLKRRPKTKATAIYNNVPYICDTIFNSQDFFPVDIYCHKAGISVLGQYPGDILQLHTPSRPQTLKEAFNQLLYYLLIKEYVVRSSSP